jgi:hypothetical protein
VLAGHRPPSAWLDRGVKSFLQLTLPAASGPQSSVRAVEEETARVAADTEAGTPMPATVRIMAERACETAAAVLRAGSRARLR